MTDVAYRRHRRRERGAAVLLWSVAVLVAGVFLALLADVVWLGAPRLSLSFLLEAPRDAGRGGGIGTILVSTAWILTVCMAVSLPIGVGTAFFLAEIARGDSWTASAVRRSLDALAAVPSVVFGLFGNALFCHALGLGFSILSGGLTLACMVLPTLIRTMEVGLRAVPDDYRRGAAALALSRVTTLRRIILPVALPALVAGLVLGVGRALAETAALIFTSGYVDRLPGSLLDSGRSLSIHIYDLAMNVPGGNRTAYASALVLVIALVVINQIASTLTFHFFEKGQRA